MKSYILYVPSTDQEYESLKSLRQGGTQNIVLWQNKFFDIVNNNFAPSTALAGELTNSLNPMPSAGEQTSEATLAPISNVDSKINSPIPTGDNEILQVMVEAQKAATEQLKIHEYRIKVLAEMFNLQMLPTDFFLETAGEKADTNGSTS